METQSDSIDLASIKLAALEAFEASLKSTGIVSEITANGVIFPALQASKAPQTPNFAPDVSSNDRLKAIQHAFQRSTAAGTTSSSSSSSSSSQNTGRQPVGLCLQPAQNVTQQNTSLGLVSTVPETQGFANIGNPIPPTPYAGQAKVDPLPKKMSTQGSLPQDTQPVSQSIYESILSKAKSGRQAEQGTDNAGEGECLEGRQDSLQEGEEGHIDLLSSYKAHAHDVGDDSDSERVDFSPTQTQHHLSQFPESQRFKTPGTIGRKRGYNGQFVETPSLPRNPLARSGAPAASKAMGLSQAFAATQAVSSPLINGLPSGPLSDRPSPNIELQARPATATLSSPLRPISDLLRTATEPYSHYKSIKQSQAERERLCLFGQQDMDATGDNTSDDDFDDEPSLVGRRRRLKAREEKVRQQLQAVSSPSRLRWCGSAVPSSYSTSRPQLSSPRTSPRLNGRNTADVQDDHLINDVPEEVGNGLTGRTHDSEEETEQEDEVEIAQSSQVVVMRTEEDKENLGFAGLEVPNTVGRLQSPVNGYHAVESSPSSRHLAGSGRERYGPPESNGVEPFAVANSQPSQSIRQPAHPPRTQLTSSGDGPSFVPQSQVQSNGIVAFSSPEKGNSVHSSTKIVSGEVARPYAKPEVVVERTSSGNDKLPPARAGQADVRLASGSEVTKDLAAIAQSPRQSSNEIDIAEMTGLVAQARRFASRHMPITETTISEISSLVRIESDLVSSAPQLKRSRPTSSSSGQVPRSSAEYETAETHLSTTTEAGLPSLPREPSHVTASPSGRKRRRMTEIAADPSPRKSGGDCDVDVAMKTIEDKEFEDLIGSSSPIPPVRHMKRRRLLERLPNATVEGTMPTFAADQDTVMQEPEKGVTTGTEGAELFAAQYENGSDSSRIGPEAARPMLRSASFRHQLARTTQKPVPGRSDTRAPRRAADMFELEGSPERSEVVSTQMPAKRSSQPASTMPARRARASIAAADPASATQISRPARRRSRGSIPTPKESPGPLTLSASENANSGSEVPPGAVVAPNRVLACFNGKTRAYYPATCLGITGSDTLRYQIQWEGFEADETDETDARGIRKLDLRIGDAVKVNLDGFPRVPHVIRGFKDKVLPPEKGGPMTDIRGYSVLLLAPKQSKSLPADLAVEAIKEAAVSAIYLDSNMWGQMKGREYEYTPEKTPSVLGFATPPERPATPATPTSRSRRNLALSLNTAPADPVGVLAGMAFAISYEEARKSSLTHLIRTNGGTVLQNGFHELFASDVIAPKSNYANLGFTALLADRHSRKEKYMQALALNLPCLSGKWIETCIAKERIIDWQPYLLPAGESAMLEGATRSRILPTKTDPSSAKMTDMIGTRAKLLDDSAVVFVTGRGKAEEKRKPFVFLTQAIGAGKVENVADLRAAKALLDDEGNRTEGYRWVFVDDNQVEAAETLLGRQHEVRVVGNEFICQSLILGGLADG